MKGKSKCRNAQFSPKPELFAYHPRNAERAWDVTVRFLNELFPQTPGTRPDQTREEEDTHV